MEKTGECSGLLESWPIKVKKRWQEVNILTLAYLGDAVYELWVRKHLLEQGMERVEEIHKAAVRYVQAKSQAGLVRSLLPELNEVETDVVLKGRNAKSHYPRNVDVVTYKHATGFEALVGYWYFTDQKRRMNSILEKIDGLLGQLEKEQEQ